MVVVDLVKNAPASGCERTVMHAGRPAGIGGCEALLAALALPVAAPAPWYVMRRWNPSLAAARSGDAKARFTASSLPISSCAISPALPRFTGNGPFQPTGVGIAMRGRPGHEVTAGTWTFL